MATTKTPDPQENEELETEVDEEVDDESQDETDDDQEVDDDEESDQEETDDDEDDESDEEDADDESDEDEEDDEDFKKRFTQFKGETPEEYLKNLEDGYAESSKEAVKLSRDNKTLKESVDRINALIASNPDLAKALQEGEADLKTKDAQTPPDPALSWAETQMRETWTKEFNSFAEKHPEIETDVQLAEQVDQQLGILRDVIWQREKRQLGMGEGLEMAWKILGKDSDTDDKQEKVRMAAKASASQGKASGGKKSKQPKPKFSEQQISVAMDMMNVDRNTAIKRLSEHVK